jgi:hypothetical protein
LIVIWWRFRDSNIPNKILLYLHFIRNTFNAYRQKYRYTFCKLCDTNTLRFELCRGLNHTLPSSWYFGFELKSNQHDSYRPSPDCPAPSHALRRSSRIPRYPLPPLMSPSSYIRKSSTPLRASAQANQTTLPAILLGEYTVKALTSPILSGHSFQDHFSDSTLCPTHAPCPPCPARSSGFLKVSPSKWRP